MKLPKLAIDNYQFTIMIVLLLSLMGLVSFFSMPRSEDPAISPPGTNVIVVYPGASTEDLERLVVDPIEEAINELEDIYKFNTTIENGLAVISVEFIASTDADDKYSDVLQKVNRVRNKLPKDILLLDIIKWSISDVVVVQLALSSDSLSYNELEKKADILKTRLERIGGVKKSKVWAAPEQEVQIKLDFEKIARLRIPLQQIIGVLQSSNANIPGGTIKLGPKSFNVKTSGSYESLNEIRNTVVHARLNKPIYIKDIAAVEIDYEEQNYFARFNNTKSIFITITQKSGTNIFDVVGAAKKEIADFKAKLSPEMKLEYVFDQSLSVEKRMDTFFSNLTGGMILVGLIVFLAFGFKTSFIIALVIPLSIIIAIGFVDMSGYGLEQMSIVAMVIALGLLVDNAIVVVENIIRFRRLGYSKKDAAIEGVGQVGWAVVSSTVTTILAFVPIIFMPGVTGDFIRSMPVTVVYILSASLILALTLTPYLSKKYLQFDQNDKAKILYRSLNFIIEKHYKSFLSKALKNRVLVLTIATVVFLLSLFLFPYVGVSFFPKAEKPQFLIDIRMPKGTNLYKTNSVTKQVESIINKLSNEVTFASNVGRGNPRVYYNIISQRETSHYAQLFVQQADGNMDKMTSLISSLRDTLTQIPGTKIEVKEFAQGPPVEAPVAIKILGENLDVLKNIAHDVETMIASENGTINVNNPLATSSIDLHMNINRDKAAILGLDLANIDLTVRAAVAGIVTTTYRDQNGEEYNLVVKMPFNKKLAISDLEKIHFTNTTGNQIPLRQVVDLEFADSPALISHFKTQRNVSITADVLEGYSVDEITKAVIKKMDEYSWPDGYNYYVGGELESREESFGGMGQALIVAIIGIFAVLVLQFKSFSQPFIVLSALPLAVIGSILSLFITGYSFSFTAFIGITSIVGIVINNSIILIDYTNQLRHNGKEVLVALKEASTTRFTPIILTTATTIGGLLPLTLGGGSLWAPMGWAIIGGLAVSTLLTLLVVPVLYLMFSPGIIETNKN